MKIALCVLVLLFALIGSALAQPRPPQSSRAPIFLSRPYSGCFTYSVKKPFVPSAPCAASREVIAY